MGPGNSLLFSVDDWDCQEIEGDECKSSTTNPDRWRLGGCRWVGSYGWRRRLPTGRKPSLDVLEFGRLRDLRDIADLG